MKVRIFFILLVFVFVFKFYFLVELAEEVVEHLAVHIAKGELLLSVLSDFGNPLAACQDIVGVDALCVFFSEGLQAIVVEDEAVGVSPTIF